MKKNLIAVLFTLLCLNLFSRETSPKNNFPGDTLKKEEYKFNGKPIVAVYSNFHYGFADDRGNAGFELERSYLGYQFNFSKNWSAKVVFDIGNPKLDNSELERIAYIKNAMISWTPGNFTVNAGLVGLEQVSLQEKFFGYRYIMKSFQDEYKFGSTADMGMVVKYKFAKWISADATFINGEGYKKLQADNKFRYGAGLTLNPIKSLTIRAYYDRADHQDIDTLGKAQENLSLFLGFKNDHFSIGAEWNDLFNAKCVNAKHQYGSSIYFCVKLPKNFELFGRWDYLASNNDWNMAKDGQVAFLGFQYSPIKYVKIAPNCQLEIPKQGNIGGLVRLNLEISL
jgi:hypothetical protein